MNPGIMQNIAQTMQGPPPQQQPQPTPEQLEMLKQQMAQMQQQQPSPVPGGAPQGVMQNLPPQIPLR